jgi:hypothetical protein
MDKFSFQELISTYLAPRFRLSPYNSFFIMFFLRFVFVGFLLACCFQNSLIAQDSTKIELQQLLTKMCQAQTTRPMNEVAREFWILDQHTLYLESLSDATLLAWSADDLQVAIAPPSPVSPATCHLTEFKLSIDAGFTVASFRERIERPETTAERVAIATLEQTASGWKIHTLAYHSID